VELKPDARVDGMTTDGNGNMEMGIWANFLSITTDDDFQPIEVVIIDVVAVLAGENPPPAEFDFPAAMLGVRAAIAR